MIVTRRKFLAGSIVVAGTTAVIAKAGLPRLLPAPAPIAEVDASLYARSGYMLGLVDPYGDEVNEVDFPGYRRIPLAADLRDDGLFLRAAEGEYPIWTATARCRPAVAGWAVYIGNVDSTPFFSRINWFRNDPTIGCDMIDMTMNAGDTFAARFRDGKVAELQ